MEMLHSRDVISQEEINGVVRVKIVITKKEFKQMVASLGHQKQRVNGGDNNQRKEKAESFEKMLYVLRKRHEKRVEAKKKKGEPVPEWQPALQSIPEES